MADKGKKLSGGEQLGPFEGRWAIEDVPDRCHARMGVLNRPLSTILKGIGYARMGRL